jgi:hypothetical protein
LEDVESSLASAMTMRSKEAKYSQKKGRGFFFNMTRSNLHTLFCNGNKKDEIKISTSSVVGEFEGR